MGAWAKGRRKRKKEAPAKHLSPLAAQMVAKPRRPPAAMRAAAPTTSPTSAAATTATEKPAATAARAARGGGEGAASFRYLRLGLIGLLTIGQLAVLMAAFPSSISQPIVSMATNLFARRADASAKRPRPRPLSAHRIAELEAAVDVGMCVTLTDPGEVALMLSGPKCAFLVFLDESAGDQAENQLLAEQCSDYVAHERNSDVALALVTSEEARRVFIQDPNATGVMVLSPNVPIRYQTAVEAGYAMKSNMLTVDAEQRQVPSVQFSGVAHSGAISWQSHQVKRPFLPLHRDDRVLIADDFHLLADFAAKIEKGARDWMGRNEAMHQQSLLGGEGGANNRTYSTLKEELEKKASRFLFAVKRAHPEIGATINYLEGQITQLQKQLVDLKVVGDRIDEKADDVNHWIEKKEKRRAREAFNELKAELDFMKQRGEDLKAERNGHRDELKREQRLRPVTAVRVDYYKAELRWS